MMNDWLKIVATLKEKIQLKLNEPYLMQHIDSPMINEDRLLYLLLPFSKGQIQSPKVEMNVTTAMLIQVALDTHEKVINSNESTQKQQLTVLAGDYFSGLYYQLLANGKDIQLIRYLAKAIKEVNEHKIAVYQYESHSIEEIIESIRKVEASIIQKFYQYFHFETYSLLVTELLYLKRLFNERTLLLEKQPSQMFNAIHQQLFQSVQMDSGIPESNLPILMDYCNQQINNVKATISKLMKEDCPENELFIESVRELLKVE
ncbi:heptaprenyl diphosphate synthase [Oikeobacillus pervagus]|uniref:Heptaprenyl diphosphate synthase n=1 Tax=Oikeobacillus pervagus TaxID=1325931 RepID=A0AAJ1SVN6_9BACI|nr:heptaprenyl diphosphate synthase component 1 [Oikeobacillus pervagus]MDQ0213698.1 heptaprenyl diphosphate synthase [Oikeobacillus pervagus]